MEQHRQAWRRALGAGAVVTLFGGWLAAAPSGCFLDSSGIGAGGASSTGAMTTSSGLSTGGMPTSSASTGGTSTSSGTGGLLANGAPCVMDLQCTSDHCVGGLCCSTDCSGTCQACTQALTGQSDGTCASLIAGTAAPAGQCAAAPPCGNDGKCGASGMCELASTSTACGPSCSGGMLTAAGTCNGMGACGAGAPAPCPGGFVCASATACKTACGADTDCSSSDYCFLPGASGTCVSKLGNGTPCAASNQCTSGFCYGIPQVCQVNSCGDGVMDGMETYIDCGGAACDAVGKTCPYNRGCSQNADCTSNICDSMTFHVCLCTMNSECLPWGFPTCHPNHFCGP